MVGKTKTKKAKATKASLQRRGDFVDPGGTGGGVKGVAQAAVCTAADEDGGWKRRRVDWLMATVPPVGSESEDKIHRGGLSSDGYFLIGDGERGPPRRLRRLPTWSCPVNPSQLALVPQYASLHFTI